MKKSVLFVFGGALLLFLWQVWSPVTFFTDELLILDATRSITQNGHWFIPYQNGVPDLAKPPFVMWCIAILSQFFQQYDLIIGRIFMALCAALTTSIVYLYTKKIFSQSAALWASIFVATNSLYLSFSHAINIDIPFALLSLLMVYLFTFRKDYKYALVFSGICFGLAFLTRFIFILFPIAAFIGEIYISKNRKQVINDVSTVIRIGGTIALLWYIPAFLVNPEVFIQGFFTVSIQNHVMQSIPGGNISSIYFYTTLLWLFPYTFLNVFKIPQLLKNRNYVFPLFLWVIVSVFLMITAPERHTWYLIQLIPPLAIITGLSASLIEQSKNEFQIFIFHLITISIVIANLFIYFGHPASDADIIKAVRAAETKLPPNQALIEVDYPFIPVTLTYPQHQVKIVKSKEFNEFIKCNRNDVYIMNNIQYQNHKLFCKNILYQDKTYTVCNSGTTSSVASDNCPLPLDNGK